MILYEWVKTRPHFFYPLDEDIQHATQQILRDPKFQRLINTQKNRSMADPFVIAMAQVRKAVVVTEEQRVPNRKKVKIPDVCDVLGIRCITVVDFMRENGMGFKRG